MKNLIVFSLFLLLAFQVNAQWGNQKIRGNGNTLTVTRQVGDYDAVSVGGPLEVNLILGSEGHLKLEAEENLLEYIETEVHDKKLKIKIKDGINLTSRKSIKVTVPFKELDEVSLAGSGDITGEAPIKTARFKTSVSGSGDLKLEVEAEEVAAKVSGSGNLDLRGNADRVRYNVSGSGNLDASKLKAKEANVRSVGSGNVRLVCNGGMLKARAVGSGNIKYSGKPGKEDFKTVGSGNISSY